MQRCSVEYWIIDPDAKTIEQYRLPHADSKVYELSHKLTEGEIESQAIPVFRIQYAHIRCCTEHRSPAANSETLTQLVIAQSFNPCFECVFGLDLPVLSSTSTKRGQHVGEDEVSRRPSIAIP
jgi:hypothetical protein